MKPLIASVAIFLTFNAFAAFGMLQKEWIEGMNKYCKYSNGVIITVKSFEICPNSNG